MAFRSGRPIHVAGRAPTAGRANDWPFQGICSSPLVDNGVVYYVSNRGELMAVDLDGFRDGQNDGLVKDEKLTREVDADILWRYDMMEELGVAQHNMANSSPVAFENLIYISTSNGQDESHVNVPSPKARRSSPSTRPLESSRGRTTLSERRSSRAWSSPAVGRVGDTMRRHRPGRRWVRGYEPKSGKRLWESISTRKTRVAEDAHTKDQHAGDPRERGLHRKRQDRNMEKGGAPLRDRPTTRRHHQDRADLALR